jgi:hypothetical protein
MMMMMMMLMMMMITVVVVVVVEIWRMWNVKAKVITVIIGATERFQKHSDNI